MTTVSHTVTFKNQGGEFVSQVEVEAEVSYDTEHSVIELDFLTTADGTVITDPRRNDLDATGIEKLLWNTVQDELLQVGDFQADAWEAIQEDEAA